ncbi:Auxin-responsive protein IAA30 [Morus notabilis]|uniref:Auxin-responsive protein n=1 Tax=Morus notabilis TaxID=981085 RepID=W9QNA0_9ROSA|nr:auxin-responsive protein IAA30 [Morus notabilis]EXB44470.1 Auxin-responsive protein IAA30 [Morus notabilis]
MGRSARGASTSSSSSSSSIGIGIGIGHESSSNNSHFNRRDLGTDLNLGLSISASSQQHTSLINHSMIPREQMQYSLSDHSWPSTTINPTVGDGSDINQEYYCNGSNGNRLYVKVYMEGHPIGRKLDILAHHGYHDLITTLDHMFNTNILWGADVDAEKCDDFQILTYEDEEGDWLMVGDVPWEMFLSAVKRLKISRACPC